MSTATPTRETAGPVEYFGAVDPMSVVNEFARNWGWVFAAGVLSLAAGVFCLMTPIFATVAVGSFIAIALLVMGVVNLSGLVFAEKGMKLDAFLLGSVQVLLAVAITSFPFASVMSMTFLVAVVLMFEGIARIALAVSARESSGWGWMLGGGIATVVASAIIVAALPSSALWVIGVLVGANLVCNGAVRMGVALAARGLAQSEG